MLLRHNLPFVRVYHLFHPFLSDEDEVCCLQEMDCTMLVPECRTYIYVITQ